MDRGQELADAMVSDAASVVQGMDAYGQHQAFVNDHWMAAYARMHEKVTGPQGLETREHFETR